MSRVTRSTSLLSHLSLLFLLFSALFPLPRLSHHAARGPTGSPSGRHCELTASLSSLLSLLSSLFALLSSLFSLLLVVVVLRGLDPMSRVTRSAHDIFSLVSALLSLSSSLCSRFSLLSSLLGADPFLCHPAILGPNHCVLRPSYLDRVCLSLLASLFSLLSSLRSHCCSFLRSHFALVTSNFASGHRLAAAHFSDRTSNLSLRTLHHAIGSAPNCLDPLRHPPWPGGMREEMK